MLFPFRVIAAIFAALGQVLGPALKFILETLRVVIALGIIVLGLVLIFALVVATAVLFGMLTGVEGWVSIHDLPFDAIRGSIPTFGVISLFICGFIPALAIALLGFTLLFKTTVANGYVGLTMFGIWIIGLIGAGLTIPNTIVNFRRSGDITLTKSYDLNGKQAVLTIKEVGMEDYTGTTLTLRGHDDSVYTLVQNIEARGRSRQQAQENARMVSYNVVLQDSVFSFDSNVSFEENAKFRFQEVSMTLYIPYGQVFHVDQDMEWILRNTINRYGYKNSDINDNRWQFTEDGLVCLTCDGESRYGRDSKDDDDSESGNYGSDAMTFDFENFETIKAGHNFDIKIYRGDNYGVRVIGREKELDRVTIRQHGDQLEFDMTDTKWLDMGNRRSVRAEVTMPTISALDLTGACKFEAFGFSGDILNIEMSGSADADLDVNYDEMLIHLSGDSDLKIEGETDKVNVDISGAASLDALGLEAIRGNVEASGASSAEIFVMEELQVDATGVSSVRYKGNPRLEVDESRASSVEPY
ncbi:MAG: DUF2807 domain-containing protein [Bacteroidetes bacterium]|nr:DUF2807 domain-containing protein [Bacteroidota bacterium]MDA1121920.1 DUF2807 domain-containing protein [Bacteroidota bacterium]